MQIHTSILDSLNKYALETFLSERNDIHNIHLLKKYEILDCMLYINYEKDKLEENLKTSDQNYTEEQKQYVKDFLNSQLTHLNNCLKTKKSKEFLAHVIVSKNYIIGFCLEGDEKINILGTDIVFEEVKHKVITLKMKNKFYGFVDVTYKDYNGQLTMEDYLDILYVKGLSKKDLEKDLTTAVKKYFKNGKIN